MITSLPLPPFPLSRKAKLIVGVSGGADSIGLLRLLLEEASIPKMALLAGHVNYGLRGRDSQRDEQRVRGLCRDWGIPCRVLRVHRFQKTALKKKRSVQDLAREIRYSFFQHLARKYKAWGVAVGHHKEDQAETLLDRLLRGTGNRGLSGLRPLQTIHPRPGKPLKIWRPLLAYTKNEIMEFLKSRCISWREDKSNDGRKYRRNQIRHEILPFLARWNPKVSDILARVGEITAAEDEFLDRLSWSLGPKVKSRWRGMSYSCDLRCFGILPLALQRRWVRQVAERLASSARGLSFERIEEVLRLWSGKEKGPRDIGFDLKAWKMGNTGFLSFPKK